MYTLYGAKGSGSASVEVALERCGIEYKLVRAATWEPDSNLTELKRVNPLQQIPTLALPDGTVMSESAAILIYLGRRATVPSCFRKRHPISRACCAVSCSLPRIVMRP